MLLRVGTYGDDIQLVVANSPALAVIQIGNAGPSTESHMAAISEAGEPYDTWTWNTVSPSVGHTLTYRTADHSGIAGKLLNQGNSGDRVVAGLAQAVITRHHDIGFISSNAKADPSQGGSPTDSVVNVASSVSIEPSVANATLRSAAFEADCAEWSMLEGSVNQQVNGTYLAAGLPFMFDYANRNNLKFYLVPQGRSWRQSTAPTMPPTTW